MMSTIEATPWVEKLASLKRFPRGDRAVEGLIQQFAKHVTDAAHAERMVDAILEEHTDWPGPAVIRQMALRTSEAVIRDNAAASSQMEQWRREWERETPWRCPRCNGWGVLGIEGPDRRIIRYDRCSCPEGDERWLDPKELRAMNMSLTHGKPEIPCMVRQTPLRDHI